MGVELFIYETLDNGIINHNENLKSRVKSEALRKEELMKNKIA